MAVKTTQVVVDFESTYNTDNGVPNARLLTVNSNGIKVSESQSQSQAIGGGREATEPYYGNIDVSGQVAAPLCYNQSGYWLKMALGAPSTVNNGNGTFTHTFTVQDTLPSVVIENKIAFAGGAGYTYHKYKGNVCNSYELSVASGSELVQNVSTIGASFSKSATPYDATVTTIPYKRVNFKDGALYIDGTIQGCLSDSLNFSLNNNIDGEFYAIGGSGFRCMVAEGAVDVSGGITTIFKNEDFLTKAMGHTETSVKVKFTSGTDSLEYIFDDAQFALSTPEAGAQGAKADFSWTAYKNNATSTMKVVLTNSIASY